MMSSTYQPQNLRDERIILLEEEIDRLRKRNSALEDRLRLCYCHTQNLNSPPPSPPLRSQKAKGPAQWKNEMEKLLNEIPTGASWVEKRQKVGLDTSKGRTRILCALIQGDLTNNSSQNHDSCPSHLAESPESDLLRPAWYYAKFSKSLQELSKIAKKLNLFQELILYSYLAVLVYKGVPLGKILVVEEEHRGKKNLSRYRYGAIWVNKQIAYLSCHGWGHRAAELFLLCPRPMAQWGRFSDSGQESTRRFQERLLADTYTNTPPELQEMIPLSIPCIIYEVAKGSLTLKEINDALGYPSQQSGSFREINIALNYPLPQPSPRNEYLQGNDTIDTDPMITEQELFLPTYPYQENFSNPIAEWQNPTHSMVDPCQLSWVDPMNTLGNEF